jgi:hypothetical protein
MSRTLKDFIELVLASVAVIAGSIAASSASISAFYEHQRVAIEQKPAIFLMCEPEIRALDAAERIKPETNAALLTNRGAEWIHLADVNREETPSPFARCTLMNYGRLPVLNLRVQLTIDGEDASLDVPGLGSSDRYSFSLINGTRAHLHFAFHNLVTLTRVDTDTRTAVPLFLSDQLLALQQRTVIPGSL